MMRVRTYKELLTYPTFEERFEYLKLSGSVGYSTFGFDRWLNQIFYKSTEWKQLRSKIILRDNGCDLAIQDRPIYARIYIHHMNPVATEDILDRSEFLLNPDYLVCVSQSTHNAIHYGDAGQLPKSYVVERLPNDTSPWRL